MVDMFLDIELLELLMNQKEKNYMLEQNHTEILIKDKDMNENILENDIKKKIINME